MPRHRVVYDKALKETPEWKILYNRYFNIGSQRYKDIFATFLEFYDWSMANGFVLGAKLVRRDPTKPWTLDNCRWGMPPEKKSTLWGDEQREAIDKWNKTVNRIRIHYGLTPF